MASSTAPLDQEGGYLYRRAEQELEQAQRADHPAAAKAHYLLAGLYLDKVYGSPEQDELRK